MRYAQRKDKEKVIKILSNSFLENPTFLFLISNKRSQLDRINYISRIAEFAFEFAFRRKGIFISDNEKGIAICFKYNYMRKDLVDFFNVIRLVIGAFGIHRLIKILYHTDYISRIRPQNGNYLYFWFLGALPEHNSIQSTSNMINHIFQLSQESEMDIYAETTVEKNAKVYQRFGFEIYRKWYNPYNNTNVWFMRRTFNIS